MPLYIQEAAARQQQQQLDAKVTIDNAAAKAKTSAAAAKKRSYTPPVAFHPSQVTMQNLQPLQMNNLQSKLISDTMHELRGRVAKRQKTGAVDQSSMLNDHVYDEKESLLPCHDDGGDGGDDNDSNSDSSSSTNSSRFDSEDDISCDGDGGSGSRFDILDELDAHPHAIQIVATSGGLITHWNESFSKITKPSTALKKIPLTIFELVDSKSLPSLYSMLALALHNIGMMDVENFPLDGQEEKEGACPREAGHDEKWRSSSHLSITLPCKSFRTSSKRYNITIVFMNDFAAMSRCFLGILTPRMSSQDLSVQTSSLDSTKENIVNVKEEQNGTTKSGVALNKHADATPRQMPCRKILRVDDDLLCQMLFDSH